MVKNECLWFWWLCLLKKPVRILYVQDSLNDRNITKRMAEQFGHKVVTAGSFNEAIRLSRSFKPHLVIADWQLPYIFRRDLREIKWDNDALRNWVIGQFRQPEDAFRFMSDPEGVSKDMANQLKQHAERIREHMKQASGLGLVEKMLEEDKRISAILVSGAHQDVLHNKKYKELAEKHGKRIYAMDILSLDFDFFEHILPQFLKRKS